MKVICTQENLRTGLLAVSRIITSSNTLPILNNLLLKTENGLLKISSTNLEISIHTLVRCKVEDGGEVCVPAKMFTDLVSTLPNKNITLISGDGNLKIEVEKHTANVKTLPSEDFPSIPTVEASGKVVFDTGVLKQALEEVVFAASTNETQPEICGVFIKPGKSGYTFVATDRYRLAEKKLPMAGNEALSPVILPLRTVHEVVKSLASAPETVEMVLGDNQVLFAVGDTHVISRVIDGQYPDYEQIIPNQFGTEAKVGRSELLGALRTSSIFSQGSNTIRLEAQEGGQVVVSSGAQDLGESVIAVPGEINGPAVSVLFNYRYILDMLNAISSAEVVIKINTDSLPVIFSEQNNQNYLYLVMPIKN